LNTAAQFSLPSPQHLTAKAHKSHQRNEQVKNKIQLILSAIKWLLNNAKKWKQFGLDDWL